MKKTFLALSIAGLLLISAPAASAQTVTVGTPTSSYPGSCISIPVNMRLGATDASTGGWVTPLQSFLATQGYFNSAYLGTGRLGPLTVSAVTRFQAAQGLPATGYMGPMTRALIQQISCSGGGVIVPPQQTLLLSSMNPSYGSVGTVVTLTGSGFTNSNTVLMDGSVVAQNVPVTSTVACGIYDANCRSVRQTLVFTIPSGITPYCAPGMFCALYLRQVTPGNYNITVQNNNGTSNALTLTVVNPTSTQQLSITGIDAPSSLTIGQTGTWVVRANAPSNAGTLHYSVQWGDQAINTSGIMAPQASSVQTTATFTHTYQFAGTYTPVFTVSDEFGHSATVSASTLVNPVY